MTTALLSAATACPTAQVAAAGRTELAQARGHGHSPTVLPEVAEAGGIGIGSRVELRDQPSVGTRHTCPQTFTILLISNYVTGDINLDDRHIQAFTFTKRHILAKLPLQVQVLILDSSLAECGRFYHTFFTTHITRARKSPKNSIKKLKKIKQK